MYTPFTSKNSKLELEDESILELDELEDELFAELSLELLGLSILELDELKELELLELSILELDELKPSQKTSILASEL